MNFDDTVNKLLHEAHFNSPYEKLTGMKRQIVPEAEFDEDHTEPLSDEATRFMKRVSDASNLRGTKLRVGEGLYQAVVRAIDTWLEAGSPQGKRGADVLIDAYLGADSGVMLSGDETHVHDLMRGIFALAYATGVKNEKLANAEAKKAKQVAAETGQDADDVFEARWRFHFDLDPSGIKPAALSRDEKAAGVTTKRQGKPLMSAERFRNILQQAQLKLKKAMDVQKAEKEQDMGDQEQARKNLAAWRASRR